jgi:nucleotidyltransferase/DNA polymerase involved in DNA repair
MLSCLLIANFAAAVEGHHNPFLRDRLLIIATPSRVRRVVASSAIPRQMGVLPKITVKQALLVCPQAEIVAENEGAYRRVANDLAEQLMHFANKVEVEYQPTSTAYYLDTDTETEAIREFATRHLNSPVTMAIAARKFTARVAAAYASCDQPVPRIAPGQEAAFLAQYPVTLLPLGKEMARRLPLLGIDTMGQLAALPKLAVWEQFGKQGKWLHDLANGIDLRSIQAYQPPKRLSARHNFEVPINDRLILRAVLQRMAGDLIPQLAGEEAHKLSLLLSLEDGTLVEAHIQPHLPVHDLLYLVRRLHDLLDQQVVQAAVSRVEVQLTDIHTPQPRQLSLFDHLEQQQRLKTVLPRWIDRYREIDFYYSELTSRSPYALPEDRFALREVQSIGRSA